MKKELNFWSSLEQYVRQVVGRSPLPQYWPRITIGLVFIVLATSLKYAKYSVAGAGNTGELIEIAARRGDYEMAQRLYESCTVPQCQSVTDELVYPERKIKKRIDELEKKLEEYPGNREIFLSLADLYGQLGDEEMAAEYHEKARILDPNGVQF